MKKLFENWRKNLNEAAFEPGRATGDIEASMGSPDAMPEEDAMRELADKFGVEVMFAKTTDGNNVAVVTFEDGEQMAYMDEEEMYQHLAKRRELNEMLSDEPNAPVNRRSFEDENYEYNKNMFYTQIYQALDQFVEKSGGRFDKSMRMRILKGIAKVLGDRK